MATLNCIQFPVPGHPTLDDFSVYLYARCGSAKTTVELLVGFIRRAEPFIGMNPTHAQVDRYLADLRRNGGSFGIISNVITALNRYMEFLGNPIGLKRPRKPRQIVTSTLSEAEIAVMIAGTQSLRERTILSLLAYSGIRNNELCTLLVRDVDAAAQMLMVETAKGESRRKVCFAGRCAELLTEYLAARKGAPEDFLFTTVRWGHRLATQDLRKLIRVAARRAGIAKRVYPHLFRHSLATNMLHRGANILTIKDQLGHAFIETTMLYLHSTNERLQADYRAFAPSYL
jgi:integrase/recombinase XerD